MKEEYLWDKTGEDLEIKKLENALQSFRYKESAPPILPTRAVILEKETSRLFNSWFPLRLAFATACCLAIGAMLAVSIWFRLSENVPISVQVINDKSEKIVGLPVESKLVKLPENKPKFIATKFIVPKQTVKTQIVKVQQTMKLPVHQNKMTAQKIEKVQATEPLTKEELYAYNQLMTALSITSSKLKMVKDKVEGVEN